ncbi:hypothetical protein KY312_00895 [Candidatus Woesearchaeota archaeon]|nr:hypothetical protein [Candidatus Woesearchaeota archaeon]
MFALYLKTEDLEKYYFNGYAFREGKYILRPDVNEEEKTGFARSVLNQLKILACFLENKFKRIYTLEIRQFDFEISKGINGKFIKNNLENQIRKLFEEESYQLGFLHIKTTPQEYVKHKKAKKTAQYNNLLSRTVKWYRKRGFVIPEKIPDEGYVCQRKTPGSLSDLLNDPFY